MMLFGAAALLAGTSAGAQLMSAGDAARDFGSRQTFWGADISPTGETIAVLTAGEGARTFVQTYRLDGSAPKTLFGVDGVDQQLDWCRFGSETALVCRYSGQAEVNGLLLDWGRLVAVSTDGSFDPTPLGERSSNYDSQIRQFDGGIVDFLPGEDAVLMARNYVPETARENSNISKTTSGLGLDRIGMGDFRPRRVERPNDAVDGFLSDGRGDVRIRIRHERDSNGDYTGRTRYDYRLAGKSKWEDLGMADRDSGFRPVLVEAQGNSVYGLEPLDGRDALYRMTLDGSGAKELVASHERVDIGGPVRLGRGLPVIGYQYTDERDHIVYFDAQYDALSRGLAKALPGDGTVTFHGASANGNILLLHAGSDADPGAYYVMNRATREMSPLMGLRPQFDGRSLATVEAVTYAARDGAAIPAYVTLPAGHEGGALGAVVLPHGGPEARDTWGFDWLAQYFAARGYAVIQPNFRGSAGYGQDFRNDNGFRNWQTAVSDIEDAARYLIAEGVADPERVAIAGWSYGGYAALLGAAEAPDLYKAAIAIAPVTDLRLMRREARDFTSGELVEDMLGSGDHLVAGSPRHRADDISVPVLLVHGGRDTNVSFDHSRLMEDALSDRGGAVELIAFEELDHGLADSEARIRMLGAAGELLDATIGS